MNDEERAAILEELRSEPKTIVARILTPRRKLKTVAFAAVCAAGSLGLDRSGMDVHMVARTLTLASPVMAVGLLVFLRRAWGQNFIAPPLAADLATTEPADQGDLAGDLAKAPGQPTTVPAGQPTVMVTVLPPVSIQPTIPISGIAVAKAGEPVYVPWEDPDGDD